MMKLKGFNIPDGYMGLLPNGKYQRFETEQAYINYIKEEENDGRDGKNDLNDNSAVGTDV